jgi:hypothetical protein
MEIAKQNQPQKLFSDVVKNSAQNKRVHQILVQNQNEGALQFSALNPNVQNIKLGAQQFGAQFNKVCTKIKFAQIN